MPRVKNCRKTRQKNARLARDAWSFQKNTSSQVHENSTDDKENAESSRNESGGRRFCTNKNHSTPPNSEQQLGSKVFVVYQPPVVPPKVDKCQQTDKPVVKRKLEQKSTVDKVGRRVVSLASLVEAVTMSSSHSSMCPKGPVEFGKETNVGLASKITFSCGCGKKFVVDSDKNMKLPVNESLLWGNTQSSIGYHSSRQLISTLEMLPPSYNLYKKLQDNFFGDMEKALQHEFQSFAKLEAEIATKNGEMVFIEGEKYPAITVILDGGWGKRSYGHSFSSTYGVGVIIGAKTGKVLFMSTRISHCHICDTSRSLKSKKPHTCFKNWTGPPNGMELDILREGFSRSLKEHGIVYKQFVGDGDSSTYSKIIDIYPGLKVEKIECTNHVCKNFTSKLMDISMNTVRGKDAPKIPVEDRRIFNPKLPRFKAGLKQAIIHHNKEGSNWQALYEDILNMPYHIFGDHTKCKTYFCNGPKDKERNTVPHVSKMAFWSPLLHVLQRPAELAPSLVQKRTSNKAECFMSVCSKFLEGKRKYFGQGYLYKLRMSAAVFSYNESRFWVGKALELIKKTDPGPKWNAATLISLKTKQIKSKYYAKKPLKVPQLAPSNYDYGDNPARPDLPDDVLQRKIQDKYESLQVTTVRIKEIENSTRMQAESSEWKLQRSERITASQAGSIFKLADSSDNKSVLDAHFGRNVWSSAKIAMNYGKDHEKTAIRAYESHMGYSEGYVNEVGFIVYLENGIFGATPDGLVGSEGLLEVKCPYVLSTKDIQKKGPEAWPTLSRSSSLRFIDEKLSLKKNHCHYYQVVMQLYVTGRLWVDYFVWSPHGIFCERIERSTETDTLWTKMLLKMERFWRENLAPELVDSRFDRAWSTYRCTPARQVGRDKKEALKRKRISRSNSN